MIEETPQNIHTVTQHREDMYEAHHALPRLTLGKTVEMAEDTKHYAWK